MSAAQTYLDTWIRWIHSTWENQDSWRTDIRPSVLNDSEIKTALFILDDGSCVFIPLAELRRVLAGKAPGNNGSIIFNVDPQSKRVDETAVSMKLMQSKRTKAAAEMKAFDQL